MYAKKYTLHFIVSTIYWEFYTTLYVLSNGNYTLHCLVLSIGHYTLHYNVLFTVEYTLHFIVLSTIIIIIISVYLSNDEVQYNK